MDCKELKNMYEILPYYRYAKYVSNFVESEQLIRQRLLVPPIYKEPFNKSKQSSVLASLKLSQLYT